MRRPIDIATRGYLCNPLGIATRGYICLEEKEVEITLPRQKTYISSGGDSKEKETLVQKKRRLQLEKIKREDEEILLLIKMYMKCQ